MRGQPDVIIDGPIAAEELLRLFPHANCWTMHPNAPAGVSSSYCAALPKPGEKWYLVNGKPYCPRCMQAKSKEQTNARPTCIQSRHDRG